jgi:hypothetical protein
LGTGNGGEGKAQSQSIDGSTLYPSPVRRCPTLALRGLELSLWGYIMAHLGAGPRSEGHVAWLSHGATPVVDDACLVGSCMAQHTIIIVQRNDSTAWHSIQSQFYQRGCLIVNTRHMYCKVSVSFLTATCIKIKSKSEHIRRLVCMECPRSSDVGSCVSCVRE